MLIRFQISFERLKTKKNCFFIYDNGIFLMKNKTFYNKIFNNQILILIENIYNDTGRNNEQYTAQFTGYETKIDSKNNDRFRRKPRRNDQEREKVSVRKNSVRRNSVRKRRKKGKTKRILSFEISC